MPRRIFRFDRPDRFIVEAVGPPGERTFYLQARKGGAVVSVSLEKTQVIALATRMDQLLDVVGPTSDEGLGPDDDAPLEQPLVDLFRVGPMALSWDAEAERVVVEAQPEQEDADFTDVADDEDGPDLVRVRLAPAEARDFVRRATRVVSSGRPACPFCGQPLEPTGHFCPRNNGHLN